MKQILKQLRDLIRSSDMSYPEVRAFEAGITNLTIDDQIELFRLLNSYPELIYPTYINYMARKRSKDTGVPWDDSVAAEVKFLETYIENRRVGDEVK